MALFAVGFHDVIMTIVCFHSKRVGLIPLKDDLPASLWQQYDLPFGLSVTEMEIVHAAYRRNNPNGK